MATIATQPLTLDSLVVNPELARRLPPAVARRYHALPVAEDRGRLTVVMAEPEDASAREAILTALGVAPCLVRGDVTAIDALLEVIWHETNPGVPTLLVCAGDGAECQAVWGYARSLAALLGASVHEITRKGYGTPWPACEGATEELIILGGKIQARADALLSTWIERGGASPSVLFARQARWPLQRILLCLQGEETDQAAVDWTLRLAHKAGAATTVLVVVPPVPVMYRGLARMEPSVAAVLSANTTLGEQLRAVAHRLANWEIEGTLRLRQGAPNWQIQQEMAQGDYDLLVVAAPAWGRWSRRLLGGLAGQLVHDVDRPVLVARLAAA